MTSVTHDLIPPLEPVLGVAEIAAYLGVKKPNVRKLLEGHRIEPMAELAVGPVWSRESIMALKAKLEADAERAERNAKQRASARANADRAGR
jgi:hypothetical protein